MLYTFKSKLKCYIIKVGLLLLISTIYSCSKLKEANRKVIVVHARGIVYSDLIHFLSSANSDGFFKEKQAQGSIKKLTPISNAVTISNIASFETGYNPSGHGIIGHTFALKKHDSIFPVSGFSQRFNKETFWEKADKNGKKYSI